MKRILIDGRFIGVGESISRYTLELLAHILEIDKENEYTLLIRPQGEEVIEKSEISFESEPEGSSLRVDDRNPKSLREPEGSSEPRTAETNSNFKHSKFKTVLVIWVLRFTYCFEFRYSNFEFKLHAAAESASLAANAAFCHYKLGSTIRAPRHKSEIRHGRISFFSKSKYFLLLWPF